MSKNVFKNSIAYDIDLTNKISIEFNQRNKNKRNIRIKNKEQENINKPPLISKDVVNIDDYIFCVENNGFENILIATAKQKPEIKYLLKHEKIYSAANEFVYNKIAQVMGIKTPDFKLFRLTDPLSTNFETEYVIGIEYFENAIPLLRQIPANQFDNTNNKELEEFKNIKNFDDYFRHHTLSLHMFCESDGLQIVFTKDGYLYRIDPSSTFKLRNTLIEAGGLNLPIKNYMKALNRDFMNNYDGFESFWNGIGCGQCGWGSMDFKEKKDIISEPFQEFLNISDDYIDEFLNTLCYFYPDCIKSYYIAFFAGLKDFIETQLLKMCVIDNF